MLQEGTRACTSMKSPLLKAKMFVFQPYSETLVLSLTLQEEEFYTAGSLELLEARRQIAEFSLPRLDLLIG
jgi:hypothetical protein